MSLAAGSGAATIAPPFAPLISQIVYTITNELTEDTFKTTAQNVLVGQPPGSMKCTRPGYMFEPCLKDHQCYRYIHIYNMHCNSWNLASSHMYNTIYIYQCLCYIYIYII